jgi:tRNA modification GTPase
MDTRETIAAIATPAGRGGIGIVRLSGPAVREIASALLGCVPQVRVAEFLRFRAADGQPLDHGLALYFEGPHSFTGEDVLELHGHGGPVVMDLLLQRALELGARLARAGEFTERAFLNDKLDLAQAEAIADLIDSGSAQAARAALRSLRGEFSARVHELGERALEVRMWIEAAIDFPEEEIDFLADPALADRMADLRARMTEIAETARQGALLRDGLTVVIAGRPNAGKSSLLNRLAGYDAAIVTPIAGTTRDVLRERISIDGLPLHVLDTAGLREAPDLVEAEGIRRAHHEIARADRVLFVVDAADRSARAAIDVDLNALSSGIPVTVIFNKVDLTGEPARVERADATGRDAAYVSTSTGAGLEALRQYLKDAVGFHPAAEGAMSARTRHLDALRRARDHVEAAHRLLHERHAGELVAQELRDAHAALGEITGEVTTDDLLGRIFASFCIGK